MLAARRRPRSIFSVVSIIIGMLVRIGFTNMFTSGAMLAPAFSVSSARIISTIASSSKIGLAALRIGIKVSMVR
ncbi:membrane protein [gut metagenome]|uniref:Membrane protein n=1 Tax=gut metagenome TaxID=749906 RepID=J9GI24_9ZZZZ